MVRHYKQLIVWQKAMRLVSDVYRMTVALPSDERFGLVAQMRRCAVSVPSNIAEGHARNSPAEYRRFLGIARGSLMELETQTLLCEQLGFADPTTMDPVHIGMDEVGRMLSTLIVRLAPSP